MNQDPKNPPNYYHRLTSKQQRNWNRAIRRVEHNAELQEKYPPFLSTSDITVIHIHYLTPITIIDRLIVQAQATKTFVVDSECQQGKGEKQGALVQIQFLHSPRQSTTILIETNHLPQQQSVLFNRIKELCTIIFNNNHEIITWGPINNEFEPFAYLHLMQLGNAMDHIDLQFIFRDWHNKQCIRHREIERRDDIVGRQSTNYYAPDNKNYEKENPDGIINHCGHHTHYDPNGKWSLQDAIAYTFNKFLDKSLTINQWQCGLDLELNTWQQKLFSKHHYNIQIEQEQRRKLVEYAINDCAAVAELYYYMGSSNRSSLQTVETTPITATDFLFNIQYELSDISEDEFIERLRPKLDKPPNKLLTTVYEATTSETHPTAEETNKFNTNPNQHEPRGEERTPSTSKYERQRRKNMKLKWKQKYNPNFQHKIKRPIYHRYDYRKIRAQLAEDKIYTSHQITINRTKAEALIGFKSEADQERARQKMKINYFSREQYYNRWG